MVLRVALLLLPLLSGPRAARAWFAADDHDAYHAAAAARATSHAQRPRCGQDALGAGGPPPAPVAEQHYGADDAAAGDDGEVRAVRDLRPAPAAFRRQRRGGGVDIKLGHRARGLRDRVAGLQQQPPQMLHAGLLPRRGTFAGLGHLAVEIGQGLAGKADGIRHGLAMDRGLLRRQPLRRVAQQLFSRRGGKLGQEAELLMVAEALAAPIATALGARGLISTRHPLHIGVAGAYAAPPANRILHDADLILFVGADTGDMLTNYWRTPVAGATVVQIDADPHEFDRSYPAAVAVQGDPRAALGALVAALGKPKRDGAYLAAAQAQMAAWRAEMAPRMASDAKPIDPARLAAEITAALPDDGILVADTGYSGIWTATMVDLEPGQSYLRAAGSLGWSFPAALGAKCAAPDRKVVCWSGDGALYYHLAELETARRRGIAVTLVVNNNSGFGQGWPNFKRSAGNRPGAAEEILRFGPTDFTAVARSFGLNGIRVERPEDIGPALREAMASPETVVVDVVTDIEARAPAPWAPEGA